MSANDVDVLVLTLYKVGIDDDRAIVTRVDEVGVVAILFHCPNDAVKLPVCR